jgi:putative PIN family toxin of toxin-antitoxin system
MTPGRNLKIVLDTNIFISFLIGKQLIFIKDLIIDKRITIIVSDELIDELREVSQHPKFKPYFPLEKVEELIELLNVIGIRYTIIPNLNIVRDPKDNFILDLLEKAKPDYLVTGDKDLLVLNQFKKTKIINPKDFMKEIEGI